MDTMSMNNSCIMKIPPLYSTVRVNTMKIGIHQAKERMKILLSEQYKAKENKKPEVSIHWCLNDVLVLTGSGPHQKEPFPTEIYVDKKCGKSVLRGADIYSAGILGSNRWFAKGSNVSVYMDLEGKCRLGWKRPYDKRKLYLGNGVIAVSRDSLFKTKLMKKEPEMGVVMTGGVWNHPKLYGIVEDWGFPQNLPSIICTHVLNPQPGEEILDLCAAPGGKTTHIATLTKDQARVVAVDDCSKRLQELKENAKKLNLKSIESHLTDAVKLVNKIPVGFNIPENGFDRILLDAPCSGYGQRPLFYNLHENLKCKNSFPPLQRKLFRTAFRLLKPGGTLVYSTCTLNRDENEGIVLWALEEFPELHLTEQHPHMGKRGEAAYGLEMIQKFDPTDFCTRHVNNDGDLKINCLDDFNAETVDHWDRSSALSVDSDTIGFFIAKFFKSG
ncbi:putative methyltransferase NSUN6 [Trichinella pseudospiralis]|uniref:Putative methyltransferase NSUN6 n=1 Tax=Trichinella pseudospiralis TaxID=6337 RepID=A0A0V1I2G7_TRIPS|nr:putative methyltransferase NSUN6 [Trichinella pseudospiralis]KRY77347.1 putative methyltransferase NSUN6 [Trichinella pseudospiralis]KRZ16975.1 putative methyltransferase NSUN6 [Trichinella pseudospiralis]KRZ44809.1 putative methyltransferase NSUN6 [Trichinella pseudospiralis]